jgi:uncharacterized protein
MSLVGPAQLQAAHRWSVWPVISAIAVVVVATITLLGSAALVGSAALAQPAIPDLKSRVTDEAGLLPGPRKSELESKLLSYEKATGHQFALLTIPSLEGESIEDFSLKVAEKWKLGDKKRDDGLLMIIAQAERKVRIEVGYGLEGAVPDAIAARVIRETIVPAFRAGDFDGGIERAFEMLMKAAAGESLGPPQKPAREKGLPRFLPFLVMLIFLIFLAGGRGGGGMSGFLIGSMMGSALGGRRSGGRGFGGGFGGGGFGGGGGGFGGGGASGGW